MQIILPREMIASRRVTRGMEAVRRFGPGVAAGGLAGLCAFAALLAQDVGHLRFLLLRDSDGMVALLVMAAVFGAGFAAAALGGVIAAED